MNNIDLVFVFGFIVTLVNLINLFCNVFTCVRQFRKATNAISQTAIINYHFLLLIIAMALLCANTLSLHRFYEAWVVNKKFSSIYLVMNGFADRIFMCIASVGLLLISLLKVPFFFKRDAD